MMGEPKFIIFNRFYWFAGQLRSRTFYNVMYLTLT